MPKNPDNGPAGPIEPGPDASANGAARSGNGIDGTPRQSPAGRAIGTRLKQFLIAPCGGPGLAPQGLSPLSLSTVEQALRNSPDIEVIDTVGPKNIVGVLADGIGGGQGVLVARMSEQKAGILHQQGQGRIVVERDQYLGLMDTQFQPGFTSSVGLSAGPAFSAAIQVVGKDNAPVAGAEVSLFGSMLPATGVTDDNGRVTLTLFGESAATVRSLYVKPRFDYWSFYQRDPDVSSDEVNIVGLRALADWPALAGLPGQRAAGWGQRAMRMDQLPASFRGQGIKIAVVDSGAATTHDELNRIRAGFDIVNKKTTPDTWNVDTIGHGSHCAGVIGGAELAGGIRGFAPDAELHVCKLFPGGQISQLIDALEYCIEKQIDVVNLSLGGAEPSDALEQQLIRARRAGIACIVAAGNSGGPVQYPASSPQVLAVAAIGKLGEFPADSYHAQTISGNVDANGYFNASFSCFGAQIAVCGPGVAIPSTVPPNNYAAWDGTSMAAPHITGLAALMLAHHPDFQAQFQMRTAARVERLFQLIRSSAQPVSLADPTRVGAGMPDAVVALGLQHGVAGASLGAFGGIERRGLGTPIGAAAGARFGSPFAAQPGNPLDALIARQREMAAMAMMGAQPGMFMQPGPGASPPLQAAQMHPLSLGGFGLMGW